MLSPAPPASAMRTSCHRVLRTLRALTGAPSGARTRAIHLATHCPTHRLVRGPWIERKGQGPRFCSHPEGRKSHRARQQHGPPHPTGRSVPDRRSTGTGAPATSAAATAATPVSAPAGAPPHRRTEHRTSGGPGSATGSRSSGRTVQPVDLTSVRAILQQVWAIEQDLNTIIVGRQEPIHLALLALLAEQHLFLLGPFGTAKSQLITELAARVGSPSGGGGGGLRTFIKLCAPGTKPEELFGPPSIAAMKQDVYRYATTNMLPKAELALLDEFFNAGEFLHGPVLSMMAERTFDNPTRMPVPLITLFSASNRVPRPESVISRAAWDRFPLRVIVEYVSDADFLRLLDLTPP